MPIVFGKKISPQEKDMEAYKTTPNRSGMSFEELVKPYLRALNAYAWQFTHNSALAQDLVQDTLLKAYRFFHRFEPGTNFWAWLLTIMRNLYFSQVRTQPRETIVAEMDHLPMAASPFAAEPPEVVGVEALAEALPYMVTDDVLQALEALPAEYRTAVLLADLLEYSYKDIALAMGCPMGTVMSRLHRGRQMLQQRLQQYALAHGYIHAEVPPQGSAATTLGVLEEQLACA
jgi:RNA polymerase sigma-70 factor (ECF subfamily)